MKTKTIIIRTYNRTKYGIKSWLFIHGIGPLTGRYATIKDPAERIGFLLENFGKSGLETMYEYRDRLRDRVRNAFGVM